MLLVVIWYNNFISKKKNIFLIYLKLNIKFHYYYFVFRFYSDIQKLPQITDQELSTTMQQLSVSHFGQFHIVSALKELYIYASKYNDAVSFHSE